MIRLTLLLCVGLYFGLMVLGEDHGQKRYGLMLAEAQPQPEPAPLPEPAAPVAQEVVFIPAPTVMKPTPALAAPPVTQVAAAVPEPAPSTESPQPQVAGGALFVATTGANVRSGPGKAYSVLESLAAGEQVLVIADDNAADGWSRIRIEGDGVEGYVAARLLTKVD